MPTWTMDLGFFQPAKLAPLGPPLGGADDRSKGADADTPNRGHGIYTSQGLMVRVERRTVEAATAVEAVGRLVDGDFQVTLTMAPNDYLAKFGSFDSIGILCREGVEFDFGDE